MAMTAGQQARRRVLLSVLMLAVLAAAIGGAWLLQVGSTQRARAGAEIIRQIRSKGLAHYWDDGPRIDWYLRTDKSQPRGWRATVRQRTAEGNFRGWMVNLRAAPGGAASETIVEAWVLNEAATQGSYVGTVMEGPFEKLRTEISLGNGEVQVRQGPDAHARTPAPDNYIPEGASAIAVRQVAAERGQGQFKMIFDQIPIDRRDVRFSTVRIRHAGRGQTQAGAPTDLVRMTYREWGKYEQTFELDQEGNLLSIEHHGGLRFERITQEELIRRFPDAPNTVQRLIRLPVRNDAEDIWRRLLRQLL